MARSERDVQEANENPLTAYRRTSPGGGQRFLFRWIARLLAGYVLWSILFTCPPNARLNKDAPTVCRRYDNLQHTLRKKAEPYYLHYAQPHVDKLRPFLTQGEQAYSAFGAPAVQKAQQKYQKYGRPRVVFAQKTADAQYKRRVKPQLARMQSRIHRWYMSNLYPTIAVWRNKYNREYAPLVHGATKQANRVYYRRLLPAYRKSVPYLQRIATQGSHIADQYIIPTVHNGVARIMYFLRNVVLPRLRIAWGRYVGPQVDKVKDRLLEYKRRKQVSDVIKEAKASMQSADSTISSSAKVSSKAMSASDPAHTDQNSLMKELESDLEIWKHAVSETAKQRTASLSEDLRQALNVASERSAAVTSGLLQELRNTIDAETAKGEKMVISLARGTNGDETDKFLSFVRTSGGTIRDKAFQIRTYVRGVCDDTEKHLDDLRESCAGGIHEVKNTATQELRAKSAGLGPKFTHDWTGIKKLEAYAEDLKEGVRASSEGRTERAVFAAGCKNFENEAAGVAASGADRLAALRRVGKRKIAEHDASPHFGETYMPAALRRIYTEMKAAAGIDEDTAESPQQQALLARLSNAAHAAYGVAVADMADLSASASSLVVEAAPSFTSSLGSAIAGGASAVYEAVSSEVVGGQSGIAGSAASAARKARDAVYHEEPKLSKLSKSGETLVRGAASSVSSAAYGTEPNFLEHAATAGSSLVDDAASQGSSLLYDTTTGIADGLRGEASNIASSVASVASKASQVFAGKEPGVVESMQSKANSVIYGTSTRLADKAAASADAAAAEISARASSASRAVADGASSVSSFVASGAAASGSSVIYGSEAAAGEKISSQASEIVFGKEPQPGEQVSSGLGNAASSASSLASSGASSASSMLSSGASEASKMASEAVYGTPPSYGEEISSAARRGVHSASSIIEDAASAASSRVLPNPKAKYRGAASAVSEKIIGRETPATERLGSSIEQVYESATSAVKEGASRASQKAKSIRDEL